MKYVITSEVDGKQVELACYLGFQGMWMGNGERPCIAMVTFEGEQDLYEVDGAEVQLAISEISRMYQYNYDRLPESIEIYRLERSM
jgi:hypothetical protein